jgi:ATPase subunit of ABC transporter with duplicated ATPase domains
MLKVTDISYSYGVHPVFNHGSFSIGKGQKVGLVGPNGAGKSTLFGLLMGKDLPSSGSITAEGSIGYVPQEVKRDPILESSSTVQEYIDPERKKQSYELDQILRGLELDLSLDQKPHNLSGGQKTKLAIARALIEEADILLLDEPTNFLDIAGKKWVMEFLSQYPNTLLIVSHDLELLDKSIDKVIVINTHTRKFDEYKGTYSDHLKLKKQREELQRREIAEQQKKIKKMEESLTKMARYTSEKGVRAKTRLRHRMEKMKENLPEMPPEIKKITLNLPDPAPSGELPIRALNISKSFELQTVLEDVSLTLYRGERVALIGPNGAGKSTFIKILMQKLKPDSGSVIHDSKLQVGYYSQEFESFDMEKTVMDTAAEIARMSDHAVRSYLARFLFSGEKINQKVGSLSGGEKTRLSIALLMLKPHNVLILEEPTTYLDVISQRVILEALKNYKGALLVVSHTEEFIKELEPNRVLFLPENKIEYWMPEFVEQVAIL